jgi:hypothetical protein
MAMPHAQGRRCRLLGKSHLALAFAGVLLTIATSLPAQAGDADCDVYSAFEPVDRLTLGAVTTSERRVNFAKNDGVQTGCPSDAAACREQAYVVPGDKVIVGRRFGSFTCASYVTPKGLGRAGWLPSAAITPLPDQTSSSPESWVGNWQAPEKSIVIRRNASSDGLDLTGSATWGGQDPDRVKRGAVNTGAFEAMAKPNGSSLAFTVGVRETLPYDKSTDADCSVRLRLLESFLLVQDNGRCGGMNVSFSGAYNKGR